MGDENLKTYSIGEVSETLGVNSSTLRSWEREFSLKIPKWTKGIGKGNRYYTNIEVNILKQIKELRSRNIPISEIRNFLENYVSYESQAEDTNEQEFSLSISTPETNNNKDMQDIPEQLKEQLEQTLNNFVSEMRATAKEEVNLLKTELKDMFTNHLQVTHSESSVATEEERQTLREQVKDKLEQRALKEWLNKPKAERLIKTGLFSATEDITKRDLFVKKYVNEHFEAEFQNALDL